MAYNNILEEQDITNDILFKEVMTKRKDICKEFIARCVPDLKIEEIKIIEREKEISVGTDHRKLRIDAYARGNNQIYAIEMMTYRVKSIEKYARYHQTMLDADLEVGRDFSELKDSILIILCTFDPLGLGSPVYTLETTIKEHKHRRFADGRRIVIVTPKGIDKAPIETKPIVQLLAKKPGNDIFTKEVQGALKTAKIEPDVRRFLMDQALRDQLMKEEAQRIGLAEGLAEGLEQGMKQGVEKGLQQGIEQGVEQGLAKGIEQSNLQHVQLLVEKLGITKQEAMAILNIEEGSF